MRSSLLFVVLIVFLSFIYSVCAQKDCSGSAAGFTVNLNGKTTKWDHFWEASVGSSHAALALREDYREQLKKVHKELGMKRVRFHGIFDDDMSVYLPGQSPQGVTYPYSWFNVDSVYDFVLSIGMKPIVEMSFMPDLLANGTECIMHYCGNTNPPKNWSDWTALVTAFAQHLVDRYGIAEVSSWYFEVWNEPNCGFWNGNQTQYYELYRLAALALKSVSPRLLVGGPITCQSQWIKEFKTWAQSNKVPLDFIDTHIYPTDITPTTRGIIATVIADTIEKSKPLPVLYSEYNSGLYDPGYHDDPFASAFVVYNIQLLNQKQLDLVVFSYWCFSDVFEEQGFISTPFHEGFGMITVTGVPKPVYRAFQLLHRTGNTRIEVSGSHPTAGVIATRDDPDTGAVMLLLYNHDVPGSNITSVNVCVVVSGLKSVKSYGILERIDQNNANAKAKWIQLGSPSYPTLQQITEVYKSSLMIPHQLPFTKISDTSISFEVELIPQAVAAVSF